MITVYKTAQHLHLKTLMDKFAQIAILHAVTVHNQEIQVVLVVLEILIYIKVHA